MRVRGIHTSPRVNWRPDLFSEAVNDEARIGGITRLHRVEDTAKATPLYPTARDHYEESNSAARDLNRIISGCRS